MGWYILLHNCYLFCLDDNENFRSWNDMVPESKVKTSDVWVFAMATTNWLHFFILQSFFVNYLRVICSNLVSSFLQVSSAHNFCKHFGPRSGPTKRLIWSGFKRFATESFFSKKKIFWKNKSAGNKKACLINLVSKWLTFKTKSNVL